MMHIIDTLGIDYEITSLQASSHVVLIVTCKYECKYILQNFTQNLQAVLKKNEKSCGIIFSAAYYTVSEQLRYIRF